MIGISLSEFELVIYVWTIGKDFQFMKWSGDLFSKKQQLFLVLNPHFSQAHIRFSGNLWESVKKTGNFKIHSQRKKKKKWKKCSILWSKMCVLSQFNQNPKQFHFRRLIRVLVYLINTQHLKVTIYPAKHQLTTYCDASLLTNFDNKFNQSQWL